MNIRVILFFSACFSGISLAGMDYRQAKQTDVPQLLELINAHAVHDCKKIVILPRKFRQGFLQSTIEKNRIFIAEDHGKIIGYKKLFIISDENEKSDILMDEIRCIDNEKNCTYTGYIKDGAFIVDKTALPSDCYRICIYNGGDFTLPGYRGKGINSMLTNIALLSCVADIKKQIQQQNAKTITLLYGVTKENAGEQPGGPCDRTVGIIKQFKSFIQNL